MALLIETYFFKRRGAHTVMSDSSADKQVGTSLLTDSTFAPSPSFSSHQIHPDPHWSGNLYTSVGTIQVVDSSKSGDGLKGRWQRPDSEPDSMAYCAKPWFKFALPTALDRLTRDGMKLGKKCQIPGRERELQLSLLWHQILNVSWRLTLNSLPFIPSKKDLEKVILKNHNLSHNVHMDHSKWGPLFFKHKFQRIDIHMDGAYKKT